MSTCTNVAVNCAFSVSGTALNAVTEFRNQKSCQCVRILTAELLYAAVGVVGLMEFVARVVAHCVLVFIAVLVHLFTCCLDCSELGEWCWSCADNSALGIAVSENAMLVSVLYFLTNPCSEKDLQKEERQFSKSLLTGIESFGKNKKFPRH
jgi:hypothetical protein